MKLGPASTMSGIARLKQAISVGVTSSLLAGYMVLLPVSMLPAVALEPAPSQSESAAPTPSPTPTSLVPSPATSAEATPVWALTPQNQSEADQRMRPGNYSPKLLSVRLTDEAGSAIAGTTVKFEVTAGDAFFDRTNSASLEVATNWDGMASASTRYNESMSGLIAAGSYTGAIGVTASAPGSSATFTFDQIHSTVAERLEYVGGRDQQVRGPYEAPL